jgi:hypothetical protein
MLPSLCSKNRKARLLRIWPFATEQVAFSEPLIPGSVLKEAAREAAN